MSPKTDQRSADRLFVLDLSGGRVLSMNTDGSDKRVIADGCHNPDGVAIDAEVGHIYWTNMGVPNLDDGTIERADLDGQNRKILVPQGTTFTPKQLHLDKKSGKLYWSDREGMRVMRSNLDGSNIETLVQTGQGEIDRRDQTQWCVGITVDPERGHVYWTQKGPDNGERGRVCRASLDVPRGEKAADRSDIEVLFDGLPEIVLTHLMEGIGLALDVPGDRMFVTDFGGSIYSARLDGSEKRMFLYGQGNLTGIAYANVVSREK